MATYRAPRRDEAAALATLGRETFVETFGHLYRPEDLQAFLTSIYAEDAILRQLDSDRILYRVAEEGGQLVGYCKLGLDVSLDYDPGDKTVIELKQLYVFASHHGSGAGQALMDWTIAEAEARNADEILLSVWAENLRGHRFYQRNGFRWIADTHFMVGNHRDEEYLFLRTLR